MSEIDINELANYGLTIEDKEAIEEHQRMFDYESEQNAED